MLTSHFHTRANRVYKYVPDLNGLPYELNVGNLTLTRPGKGEDWFVPC